ncbi:MAG: hypothetical protein ACI9VS_001298 [Candidatus Binatia bacterium]
MRRAASFPLRPITQNLMKSQLQKRCCSSRSGFPVFALSLSLLVSSFAAWAAAPLHQRIDETLAASRVEAPPALTDDATFLRRACLDLTGRIPAPDAARAFLTDASPDKRAKLVDRLLASREHIRHMAITFNVTLIERRSDPHVKSDAWTDFLFSQFETNAPYTELVRAILSAEGEDAKKNGPAKFLLAREAEPNALTRDIGRMFFGMDMQCAQCHDHPRIDDYTQRDYYGIYAFLNRTYLFRPDAKKPGVVAEKPTGEVSFKSVFTQAEGQSKPRLPGDKEITEPVVKAGQEYQVKPDKKNKKLRPIPTYARRAQLAKHIATGENLQFRRNIANRLWAHMMGAGIVEPVDVLHSDNPPTHPLLLDLLADEIAAMNFDMRAFLRELALSKTYQRGFDMPKSFATPAQLASKKLLPMESEHARLAAKAAEAGKAFETLKEVILKQQTELKTAKEEMARTNKSIAAARKARDAEKKKRDAAAKPLAPKTKALNSLAEASKSTALAAAELKDDKELAKAAAVFADRRKKLEAEVAKLKKGLEPREAKLAELEKTLTKATADVKEKSKRENAAIAKLAPLQAKYNADNLRRANAKLAASHTKQRLDSATALVEFAKSEQELGTARTASAKAEAADRESKSQREKRLAQASASRVELAATQTGVNQILLKHETAGRATAEATLALADLNKTLGKSDLGEPTKKGPSADDLLKDKSRRETDLKTAKANQDGARQTFLASAKQLVSLKSQTRENTIALAKAEAHSSKLADELAASQRAATEQEGKTDALFTELTETWSKRFAVGGLTPLTPEQLCWSMLLATGEAQKHTRAGVAEFEKKNPLKKGAKAVPARATERDKFVEKYVYGKLKSQETNFISLFGSAAGSPQNAFFATPDQALFFANGGNVRGWLNPSGSNLTERLSKLEKPEAFAEELYLSVLTRRPDAVEIEDVKRDLAARGADRKTAAQELAWGLLTSIEFRFRH